MRRGPDWRGWLIVAWVVVIGLLYGKMVIEQRGGKVQAWLVRQGKDVPIP